MKLHNYFKEFGKAVKTASTADTITRDLIIDPLVNSSELFYRDDSIQERDKIVYIFLDGSDSIRAKKINEDWNCNMPIVYIGMGELDRPLDHWDKTEGFNPQLRDILTSRYLADEEIYLLVYATGMNTEEAKYLEADLIQTVHRLQSPLTGMQIYKSKRAPQKLVNNKNETSNQKVYSTNGIRHKKK